MDAEKIKRIKLHFIIGIGRSGTTLLSSILNSHSNVVATPEVLFILFFYDKFKDKKKISQKEIELLIEYIELFSNLQPFLGWNFNSGKLKSTLISDNYEIAFPELCKMVYLHFERKGKDPSLINMVVDKNPAHTLIAEKLLDLFPDSKFILMVRDYRANILSRKQNPHLRGKDTFLHALRWNLFNSESKRLIKKYPEKIILLKYEEFVSETDFWIKKVCGFLKIDFREEMLQFYKSESDLAIINEIAKKSIIPERIQSGLKKYTDLTRPVNSSRTDSWRTELSRRDIEIAEYICGSTGDFFGYKKTLRLNFKKKLKISFRQLRGLFAVKAEHLKDRILFRVPIWIKMMRVRMKYSDFK